jgi:NACalpha-BTF3-like transcription factor
MDGMSWFVDREEPEEPQTSRVRIIVVPSDDIADVMANTGVARETIRATRINTLIFLTEEI